MEVHPGVFVSDVATADRQPDLEVGGGAEEATEVLLVLEGEAQIEIEDGPVLQLKPGDMRACQREGDDLAPNPAIQGDVGARRMTSRVNA
jgi:hypothetical protein